METKEVVFFKEESLDRPHTPEELQLVLERVLNAHSAFEGPFAEVTLAFATAICTVVPATLFDANKAIEYLKFNSKILASDFVAHDQVSTQETVVVYIPFVNINNVFFDRYGSFKYYHATTLLLKEVLELHKLSSTQEVFVNVQPDFFTLIITANGKLQLCNTYSYKTPEDFIYYVLFCFEQLKLNPDSVRVTLSGAVSKNDALYNLLYTYVRHIEFINTSKFLVRGTDQEEAHHHYILKSIN